MEKKETKPFWLVFKKTVSFIQMYLLLEKKWSPQYSLECSQWFFKALLVNLKCFILNFASVIPDHFLTVWIFLVSLCTQLFNDAPCWLYSFQVTLVENPQLDDMSAYPIAQIRVVSIYVSRQNGHRKKCRKQILLQANSNWLVVTPFSTVLWQTVRREVPRKISTWRIVS